MSAERWRRIEELYHAAQARPANERAAFLDEACAGDATLRQDIESLLAQPVSTDGFLERPALEAVQPISTMRLAAGTRLGSYQIVGLLGAGGMGEVYRARDTKLGRDVAIKILPSAFTSDPERLARFEREARMLASLNHPHIGAIYGLEDSGWRPRAGAGAGRRARRWRTSICTSRPHAPSQDCRSPSLCRSRARSPTRSKRRTRRASSIAI